MTKLAKCSLLHLAGCGDSQNATTSGSFHYRGKAISRQTLSDAEIILQVTDDVTETVAEPEVEPSCPLIQHGNAVRMFDSCIAWLQQQDEATVYNLSMLSDIRELAAKKRLTSISQKKLTDYFSV